MVASDGVVTYLLGGQVGAHALGQVVLVVEVVGWGAGGHGGVGGGDVGGGVGVDDNSVGEGGDCCGALGCELVDILKHSRLVLERKSGT